jgi:hypothetical protein
MSLKHLLSGIAIAATLTTAGLVWAQNNPSGGNGMGMPGQNFGNGGNLSPDDSGGDPTPAPPATSVTMSAHHAGAMHAHHKDVARSAALTGGTAERLNRKELARVQTESQTTASKQSNQVREDQATKQEQLRNIYDMIRASSYKP